MKKKYEVFEHTADVGIIAYGNTLEEMFENAAYGMFDIMTYALRIKPLRKVKVSINSPTLEDLLVDWLSELLYVFSTELFVMNEFQVKINKDGEYTLKAVCWGENYNKRRHGIKTEIKAITYHEIEINEKEGYVKILFDI